MSSQHGSIPSEGFEHLPPQEILQWAVDTYGQDLVMTSSFGLNGVALIHMLQEITRNFTVLFVDTGYHFPETLKTKQQIEAKYDLRILVLHPQLSIERQAQMYGPNLFEHAPDLCCALRKVQPVQRALEQLEPEALLNARSRFQAKTRQNLPVVELTRSPVRIQPLALWSQQLVEDYVRSNKVPYNPLHNHDFPSIGCWPCTAKIRLGDNVRAGRWVGKTKEECGLWTA